MPLFVQLDLHNDEKKRQDIECSIIVAYVISLDRENECLEGIEYTLVQMRTRSSTCQSMSLCRETYSCIGSLFVHWDILS